MTQKCFGDLSREEKLKLFEAYLDGKKIEYFSDKKSDKKWFVAPTPFAKLGIYRVASEYTPFGELSEEKQKELVWARYKNPESVERFIAEKWTPLSGLKIFNPLVAYRLAK